MADNLTELYNSYKNSGGQLPYNRWLVQVYQRPADTPTGTVGTYTPPGSTYTPPTSPTQPESGLTQEQIDQLAQLFAGAGTGTSYDPYGPDAINYWNATSGQQNNQVNDYNRWQQGQNEAQAAIDRELETAINNANLAFEREQLAVQQAYQQGQLSLQQAQNELDRLQFEYQKTQDVITNDYNNKVLAWQQTEQENQLSWERESQANQLGADREKYAASLAALGPAKWMELSSYTGATPTVQDWMQPMLSNYNAQAPASGQMSQIGQWTGKIPQQASGLTSQNGQWTQPAQPSVASTNGQYIPSARPTQTSTNGQYFPSAQAPQGLSPTNPTLTGTYQKPSNEMSLWTGKPYGGITGGTLKTGDAIPGYTASDMSNMPALDRPSAQYVSRMAPTDYAMWGSYTQAQSGRTPEDLAAEQRRYAAPAGRSSTVSYAR